MSILLFISTIMLNMVTVTCAGVFLWLNNFSIRSDVVSRNVSLKRIMTISMISSMIGALMTGLLSNSNNVENSINLTVILYFIIAISMLLVILSSCVVLIYRLVSKKSYPEGTSSGVSKIIKIVGIGTAICLILAWLLS